MADPSEPTLFKVILSDTKLHKSCPEGINQSKTISSTEITWPFCFDPKAASVILVDIEGNPVEDSE